MPNKKKLDFDVKRYLVAEVLPGISRSRGTSARGRMAGNQAVGLCLGNCGYGSV